MYYLAKEGEEGERRMRERKKGRNEGRKEGMKRERNKGN